MEADLLELRLENRRKNVFVTQPQPEESREPESDGQLKLIPIITQSPSMILESGVRTLQCTLVLKKREELDNIDTHLTHTRAQIHQRMRSLTERRELLQRAQEESRQRAERFQRFVEENELKRRRAMKKFQMEKQQSQSKEEEREELANQMERLQDRRMRLRERVSRYQIFEEFLMKTLDLLPDNYLGLGTDLVAPIIRRYETLSISRQDLLQQLQRLTDQMKTDHNQLDTLKEQHNTYKLMTNQDLSDLQTQLDQMTERNKQLEMSLQLQQAQSRDQVEELGRVLLAVRNLAEQCQLSHYGPLQDMNTSTMMDMIKEYMVDKADLEDRAMRLAADSGRKEQKKTQKKNSSRTQKSSQQ
ncbi:coiled-coil domain-containing protein 42 homolog [Danio aesculapii]|uniref:coiled-coil domain-containing protein 42 homolog n=1 Tax=Danio aesculapii TaxID=1142201 RepID=UPI0024BF61D4|nr:coiled-coil domain-containing protein 42 homolog [Danio aesculapii]